MRQEVDEATVRCVGRSHGIDVYGRLATVWINTQEFVAEHSNVEERLGELQLSSEASYVVTLSLLLQDDDRDQHTILAKAQLITENRIFLCRK